jgi:hypothetical protein
MTTLFLEYQAKKELKDTAYLMIGKLYYWCKDLFGDEIPYKKTNLMKVTRVYDFSRIGYHSVNAMEVDYSYVDTGLSGTQELSYFLQYAKPYTEDSL